MKPNGSNVRSGQGMSIPTLWTCDGSIGRYLSTVPFHKCRAWKQHLMSLQDRVNLWLAGTNASSRQNSGTFTDC
jgi:hypothetical protein